MAEDNKKEDNLTGLDQFSLDKIAGVKMGGIQPKGIDTKEVDKQIAALEKPADGSVYDKMAARYRSQGKGTVLRTQKNLANLFSPTINLIQEREAAAQARFTLLKDKLPEFDDSNIFGDQSGNPMPIIDEVKSISQATKEDMRMLSRLNVNDERYDEIKKRIEKNQDAIVAFDAINEKLLEIRNSQDGREDDSQWSQGMDATTRRMWEDIYSSSGQNIKIQDGKLIWTSTGGKSEEIKTKSKALNNMSSIVEVPTEEKDIKKLQKNLQDLGYDIGITGVDGKYGDKTKAAYEKFLQEKEDIQSEIDSAELEGVGETRTIDLNEIGDGPTMIDNIGITKDTEVQDAVQTLINNNVNVNDPRYNQKINALIRTINSVGPKGIKSLIFDGFGAEQGDVLKSTNTDSFIEQIIQNNPEEFGIKDVENLTQQEIADAYDIMRSRDVTYSYSNESGESQTLQSQYLQWYRNEIDTKVKEGIKSKLAPGYDGGGGSNSNITNSGVNYTVGTRGARTTKYSNKTVDGYNLKDGEIGITASDINSILANYKLGDYMANDLESELGYNKNYVIGSDNVIRRYDNETGKLAKADMNEDSDNPRDVDAWNAIMTDIKTNLEKEGISFDFTKAVSFSHIKSRKDEVGLDNLTSTGDLDFSKQNPIDLKKGSGSTLVSDFNKKYAKYGFYAKKNDGVYPKDAKYYSKETGGDKAQFGPVIDEMTGEGVLRIYYRKPQHGKVLDGSSGNKYTYSPEDYNGDGSYIDVIHDMFTDGVGGTYRYDKNLEYLIDFMKTMHGQSDVQDYWNEEVKYTGKKNEDGDPIEVSDTADEITY